MKAIKVIEPFKVEIVDVPNPTIKKDDDVIVRITSGGICGSDIGIWNGTNSLATYPRLIGHEFGGIVTEVGSAVTSVKPGDKVAVDPVVAVDTAMHAVSEDTMSAPHLKLWVFTETVVSLNLLLLMRKTFINSIKTLTNLYSVWLNHLQSV